MWLHLVTSLPQFRSSLAVVLFLLLKEPKLVVLLGRLVVKPGVNEDMARGQQKIQSQQKNAKKQAESKKKHGHDQKAAAKAALVYTCAICRTQMPDPKTFKQHFESKHPKTPLPPELVDVEA
uniref:Zinc finger protein 706 n=2 Tax=Geotrypetes seraphini TaxID=260995 RepID=A0A6P8QR19_GEOSA|nr:zinc finger protein 706 isoform X1 [Geotrypetes seraphini]XP_033789006.1 zinc finger protein 706 isoform X1 [Geotrypetes seraphini]XP_033789008.1 zinc finger protein 706 isoform X1 [Geotrypetes seraphini]XP_033789009.1 zinc finger protein 706 isoform X1 [Geotrypetes seraphini]